MPSRCATTLIRPICQKKPCESMRLLWKCLPPLAMQSSAISPITVDKPGLRNCRKADRCYAERTVIYSRYKRDRGALDRR